MRLTSLRVKNYGCLADFELSDIGPLAIFVGANGSGKSTLFDVFAFLRDALRDDIRSALAHRGGFNALRTHAAAGPIEIELQTGRDPQDWDPNCVDPAATYALTIDCDAHGPYVRSERITAHLAVADAAKHMTLLDTDLDNSNTSAHVQHLLLDHPGSVISDALRMDCIRDVDAPRALAAVEELRAFLRGAYRSRIEPELAKQPAPAAASRRLSERGDNLAAVVKHLAEHNAPALDRAFCFLRRAAPDIERIKASETANDQIVLQFVECGHTTLAHYMSDGAINALACAVLLNESERRPLLLLDEPGRSIYPSLMWELLEEIGGYIEHHDAQVFLTTHVHGLLDAADPRDVFWMHRERGVVTARHASDDPKIVSAHDHGDQLGFLWRTGWFEGAHPS